MRRILVLALNDLRLTVKDRPVIFWMVIMPIAFIYIFGAMRGGGSSPQVSLGVVDEDQSFLSRAFTDELRREGFAIRDLPGAGADSAADSATGSAADSAAGVPRSIRIPAGFQDSIAVAHQVPIHLRTEPDADAAFTMTAEMHLQRAIIQTLVNLIETTKRLAGAGEPEGATDGRAEAREERLGQTMGSLASLFQDDAKAPAPLEIDAAFERVYSEVASQPIGIAVESEVAGKGRPVPSGMRASLPAMITLFMMINTAIYGAVFLAQEKQDGVLARIATFPISRTSILAGKLLGRTLLGLAQAAVLLLAGRFLLGAYLGNSLVGLILVVLCLALTVGAIALFWGAVLRRVEQATAVALVVSLFLGAIGGCWWPLEVVPGWMRVAGHISPAAWAMDGFHALISFGAGTTAVFIPCLILLGYAVVLTLIGGRLLSYTD